MTWPNSQSMYMASVCSEICWSPCGLSGSRLWWVSERWKKSRMKTVLRGYELNQAAQLLNDHEDLNIGTDPINLPSTEVCTPIAQVYPFLGDDSHYKPGMQLISKAPWGGAPWELTDHFPCTHGHRRAQTRIKSLKHSFRFSSPSFLLSQVLAFRSLFFLSLMPHVVSGCPKFPDLELSCVSFARCSIFTVCSSVPFTPCAHQNSHCLDPRSQPD